MGKRRIKRRGYTRRGNVWVRGTTYEAEDRGAPGKTPKSKKWFQEAIGKRPPYHLGWKKDKPQEQRIRLAIASRPKNWSEQQRTLSASRALQALANISTDRETASKAKADAEVLRRRLR